MAGACPRRTAVKNAGVVDDEALAGFQAERDRHHRIVDDGAKMPVGGVPQGHPLEGHIPHGCQRPVVEAHAPEFTIGRQFDQRAAGGETDAILAVEGKARAVIGEHIEMIRVFLPQAADGGKSVDDHAVTTGLGTLETVKHLNRRHRIPVGIVGVGLKGASGVGKIHRSHLVADVEVPAIVGLPHVTEEIDDAKERARRRRSVDHPRHSVTPDVAQPFLQLGAARLQGLKVRNRHLAQKGACPWGDRRIRPAAFTNAAPVVGVPGEPGQFEGDRPHLRCEVDHERVVADGRRGNAEIGRDGARCDQPLTIAGVTGLGISRIVTQPDGVEAPGPQGQECPGGIDTDIRHGRRPASRSRARRLTASSIAAIVRVTSSSLMAVET